jgi:hypothetical protein
MDIGWTDKCTSSMPSDLLIREDWIQAANINKLAPNEETIQNPEKIKTNNIASILISPHPIQNNHNIDPYCKRDNG